MLAAKSSAAAYTFGAMFMGAIVTLILAKRQ
jgi:hypothetical protein